MITQTQFVFLSGLYSGSRVSEDLRFFVEPWYEGGGSAFFNVLGRLVKEGYCTKIRSKQTTWTITEKGKKAVDDMFDLIIGARRAS